MRYEHITEGSFLERPNRFIARVLIDGQEETVHVKNTGRCRELLQKGVKVFLEKSGNPERKTRYDLVAVMKHGQIVNMDSQAPNRAAEEWLRGGGLTAEVARVKPEFTYGNSRFDFLVETQNQKILVEVKGVTLENNGVAAFPDAPSERAVKHVGELIRARQDGYETYVLFVIQMKGIDYLVPNAQTHPAFAQALEEAYQAGVHITAYDTVVCADSMVIDKPVPVHLYGRLSAIPELLLKWYDCSHRILPWRERPEPYRVWVSEIMLQQTRVEAVKPYFERFMQALPEISDLAEADEQKLLKLWEGLGYYNRVRNLQKAAVMIESQHDGRMPDTYEELMALPGIGSYTAGAVASIAYGKKLPAVDGNVLRVVSRVLTDERDILDTKVKKDYEAKLTAVMPEDRPGDFNQAMMELGAVVCAPNGMPKCDQCPLSEICLAREENRMLDFPRKTPKKARVIEQKTVLLLRDENRAALKKRPAKGLLAGMYEFPSLEGHQTEQEVIRYLHGLGMKVLHIKQLQDTKHIFTHREWHMIGYSIRVDELEPLPSAGEGGELIFADAQGMTEEYPIPSAFAAYTARMREEDKR